MPRYRRRKAARKPRKNPFERLKGFRGRAGLPKIERRPVVEDSAWVEYALDKLERLKHCPSGKIGYPTEAIAESQRLNDVTAVYECPDCGLWHRTTRIG